MSRRTPLRFALCFAVAGLGACASDVEDPAGAGGTGAGGGSGGGAPGSCPEQIPSGECDTVDLSCDYVDSEGCPRSFYCWEYLGPPAMWDESAPDPGGSCATSGQVCEYSIQTGDSPPQSSALECGQSGTWEAKSLCPEQVPEQGAACAHSFLTCMYDVCPEVSGDETIAQCQGTWMVSDDCPMTAN